MTMSSTSTIVLDQLHPECKRAFDSFMHAVYSHLFILRTSNVILKCAGNLDPYKAKQFRWKRDIFIGKK